MLRVNYRGVRGAPSLTDPGAVSGGDWGEGWVGDGGSCHLREGDEQYFGIGRVCINKTRLGLIVISMLNNEMIFKYINYYTFYCFAVCFSYQMMKRVIGKIILRVSWSVPILRPATFPRLPTGRGVAWQHIVMKCRKVIAFCWSWTSGTSETSSPECGGPEESITYWLDSWSMTHRK